MPASFANCMVLGRCFYEHPTKKPKEGSLWKSPNVTKPSTPSSFLVSLPPVKLIIANSYTAQHGLVPGTVLRVSCKFNLILKQPYEVDTNIISFFRGKS